jgi:hypothetical protein
LFMGFMYPVSDRKPTARLRKISHFSHKSRRRMQIPIGVGAALRGGTACH